MKLFGSGFIERELSETEAASVLEEALNNLPIDGRRVLILIPDGTRTAPVPFLFREINRQLAGRAAALDYMVALGTHPAMPPEALDRLVGYPLSERGQLWPNVRVINHDWKSEAGLVQLGVIRSDEMSRLTGGLSERETPVRLNRQVLEHDFVLICGPVFPHEVVGFSGGAKYLFPGIAGAEIIDSTHWLGALVTNLHTIGIKDTPVRRVINAAAAMLPVPAACIAFTMQGGSLHGLYVGETQSAWSAAADLSARLNVVEVAQPYQTVLSCPSLIYDDLWTAAKAAYKTEPAVADGGEIIIYAPHLTELSYVHGHLLREIGYHVRDYFTAQMDRFAHVPLTILAHSTHVRGIGSYENGVERPRIQVTLATGIPEEICHQTNLGYRDPASIRISDYQDREGEGVLYLPHAGEQLIRCPQIIAVH